jgi:hypothetical protein
MARFARLARMSRLDWIMYDPKPYVPPDVAGTTRSGKQRDRMGGPQDMPSKPWLALRAGETYRAWQLRVSRSCYRCGLYIADKAQLEAHEEDNEAHHD